MIELMKLHKPMAIKIFAINFNRLLKERGLSQKEFSAMLEMSPQQLSFYARAKRQPSEDNLSRIAEVLELSNAWELYRMPEEIGNQDFRAMWNVMIDLHSLSPENIARVKDYIDLLMAASKGNGPPII